MRSAMGATTVGELASAIGMRQEEASIVAELKAGSEDAYSWLIAQYHQPIYSLVYRIVDDPADAPDTVQEVFLKVFRGMNRFNGESSLKTWMRRVIADGGGSGIKDANSRSSPRWKTKRRARSERGRRWSIAALLRWNA